MKIFTVNIDSEGVTIAQGAVLSTVHFHSDLPALKIGMHSKRGTDELFPKYIRVLDVGSNTEIYDVAPVFSEENHRLTLLRNLEESDGTDTGVLYFNPEPETSGRIVAGRESPLFTSGKLVSGFIPNGRTHNFQGKEIKDSCNPAVALIDKDSSIDIRFFDIAKHKPTTITVEYTGTEFVITDTKVKEFKPRKLEFHKEQNTAPKDEKKYPEKKVFRKPDAPKKGSNKHFERRGSGNYAFAGLAQQMNEYEAYTKNSRRKNRKQDYRDYADDYE